MLHQSTTSQTQQRPQEVGSKVLGGALGSGGGSRDWDPTIGQQQDYQNVIEQQPERDEQFSCWDFRVEQLSRKEAEGFIFSASL